MAERGAGKQASELRAVSHEVREVAENPSLERLEEKLTDLSERFEAESKKRAQDEEEKLMIEFFLFFLAVYLQLFLWMIGAPPLGQ
jgi:hypothetical protein